MTQIHQKADVHPEAQIHESVMIGAYTQIGPQVTIGADTVVGDFVRIAGRTTIGVRNQIHSYAALGGIPQDKKYRGENAALVIGDDNTIREFCTFNIGTDDDRGVTSLGNHNWIMAYVHLAHDCQVGNHVTMANHATLAGHVTVGDWVTLGGFVGVHQFVQIGDHAFVGISAVITQDIPPYVMVAGQPATPHGINTEGLKRRGFSATDLVQIKKAYRILYRQGYSLEEAKLLLANLAEEQPAVLPFSQFLEGCQRGILR